MKDDCIFCKLANGVIPTNSIYEDDDFKPRNQRTCVDPPQRTLCKYL